MYVHRMGLGGGCRDPYSQKGFEGMGDLDSQVVGGGMGADSRKRNPDSQKGLKTSEGNDSQREGGNILQQEVVSAIILFTNQSREIIYYYSTFTLDTVVYYVIINLYFSVFLLFFSTLF